MKIGIYGTGAYGLALTSILCENKNEVTMWTKFESEKEFLLKYRENKELLPDYKLPGDVKITNSIEECARNKDLLIIAIPVPFITELCIELSKYTDQFTKICIASKGIEQKTGYFVSQIISNYLKTEKVSVISGPSFAKDIIEKKPIGLSLASKDLSVKAVVETAFSNDYLKLRYTEDIIGVEICGAIKNVIALAAGILEGLGASDSTRAMLVTEALHDIEEIIEIFNGDKRTILSYAGFGDLLLTCTSTKSRNYSYGILVGKGLNKETLDEYIKINTVEGYFTVESIHNLLRDKKVNISLISILYDILKGKINSNELLKFLIEKI